jgi:hypothetical protein
MTMQYLYFIPSIVYIAFSPISWNHVAAFAIMIGCVYYFSSIRVVPPEIGSLPPIVILFIVLGGTLLALAIQALFGGLDYFNLDIDRVYEFRRIAAAELPAIFGYVYSNVSSALVPLALLLSINYGSRTLTVLTIVCSILLFGMTHHKTVLFGPFVVLVLYKFYERKPRAEVIALIFLAIPVMSMLEIFFTRSVEGVFDSSYWTSLVVRRALLVPAMLDSLYVDYFREQYFYWSWSRVGGLFMDNPYGQAPPFVIGYQYFSDDETSANAGVISSGYANAGLIGVALYSILAGLLLAMLNSFGRRAGHAFVAAASLMIYATVMTTADLLTAVLSHGVLLLVVLLALFPVSSQQVQARPRLLNA